ncbi:hypothetical protein GO755_30485 [Spirosoma sp. HMF4905]|uniref:Uncharacterized protein n=1 Tax=Spirosoma arboris TaxID=2682092 RepID=A0A7K1SKR5_9BACT|nr:hypothetical protein [Spirosoma arboris]MVM34399.1 hypothetical protein [Spirosoma arboris]
MKTLIANQPLSGDYGYVGTDETFQAEDDVAKSLLERKLATLSDEQLEAVAESDEDPDAEKKDDKGAASRKTKDDKTVSTANLTE